MKKRVFGLLLCTVLVLLLLPMMASAETQYNVWVNGEQFTSEKTVIACGDGTATLTPPYWEGYHAYTLTLTDAEITKGTYDILHSGTYTAIGTDTGLDLEIKLNGTSTISGSIHYAVTGSETDKRALKISGSGSLVIDDTDNTMTGLSGFSSFEFAGSGDVTINANGNAINLVKDVIFTGNGPVALTSKASYAIDGASDGTKIQFNGTNPSITLSSQNGVAARNTEITGTHKAWYDVEGSLSSSSAVYTKKDVTLYKVWVNGTQFDSTNMTTGIPCGDGTATLTLPANTGDPYTLTLTDAQITKGTDSIFYVAQSYGIASDTGADLNIVLNGENMIGGNLSFAVAGNDYDEQVLKLRVSGAGSLSIEDEKGISSFNIVEFANSGDVTINASNTAVHIADEIIFSGSGAVTLISGEESANYVQKEKGQSAVIRFEGEGSPITLSSKNKTAVMEATITGSRLNWYAVEGNPDSDHKAVYTLDKPYDVWVNGKQFRDSSLAAGIQCGDGKATLALPANTGDPYILTLDGVTLTEEYTSGKTGDADVGGAVYARGDLNVVLSGTNTISLDGKKFGDGISADGDLKVSGDGSLSIETKGIFSSGLVSASGDVDVENTGALSINAANYGINALPGNVTIGGSGDCTITTSGAEYCVGTRGNMEVSRDGNVTISCVYGNGVWIPWANENSALIVSGGEGSSLTVTSKNGEALYAPYLKLNGNGEPITFSTENGSCCLNYSTMVNGTNYENYTIAEGGKSQKKVVYKKVAPVDVWVNGEQFTTGKTTITCGSGTATLDTSKTPYELTLDSVKLTNGYTDPKNSVVKGAVLAKKDLTIILKGTNTINLADLSGMNGVYVDTGALLLKGDGDLTINAANTGIEGGKGISLTGSGNITVNNATGYYAIYVPNGALEITGSGDVTVNNAAQKGMRGSTITISGSGDVNVTSTGHGLDSYGEITLSGSSGAVSISSTNDSAVYSEGQRVKLTGRQSPITFMAGSGKAAVSIFTSGDRVVFDPEIHEVAEGAPDTEKVVYKLKAKRYDVWVNGEQFNEDKLTIACGSGTAVYDPAKGELTLTDATITNEYSGAGIKADCDIDIILNGTNKIDVDNDAIDCTGDLSVSGSGDLNIDSKYGICEPNGGNVTIGGSGIIKIECVYGYGIYAQNDIVVTFSNTNNTVPYIYGDAGIYSNAKITISGEGDVYISGIDGLYAEDDITFSGSGSIDIWGNHKGVCLSGAGKKLKLEGTSSPIEIETYSDGIAVYNDTDDSSPVEDVNSAYEIKEGAPDTEKVVYQLKSTLYAVTVSVNDSAMGTASAAPNPAKENETVSLTATPNAGYHFVEWQSADVDASTGAFTMPAKAVTVTALFEKDLVELHEVKINGFENPIPDEKVGDHESLTVPEGSEVRFDMYQLQHWMDANGNYLEDDSLFAEGQQYRKGARLIAPDGFCFASDCVFLANDGEFALDTAMTGVENDNTRANIWTVLLPCEKPVPGAYAVTVSVNDSLMGTASASPNPAKENETVTLTATPNTGYQFREWQSADVDASTGAFQMPAAEVSVTAVFEAKTSAITFDKQGGDGGDDTVTAVYGSAMPAAAMPTQTGYIFAGYFDAATDGNQYYGADGLSVKNWDKEDAAVTLYAHWTTKQTAITFDKQGGTGGDDAVTAVFGSAMPTAAMPTQTGYIFDGYFDALTDGNQYYGADGLSVKPWDKEDAAVTLYAHWTKEDAVLTGISITKAPGKTDYVEGESFDGSDMIVTAAYSDGSTKAVKDYTVKPSGALTTADKIVEISYTENGVTKSVQLIIRVTPAGPVEYKIIVGAGQVIYTNASSAKFASDADFGKLDHVEVDGKTVAKKYYTAESGSTVITFNKDFINNLVIGKHTLTIVSKDGSASTTFTLLKFVPKTGDSTDPGLLVMLTLVSLGMILLASAKARKRN